jgi:adenosylcobinamide kinase/adenosylcobinamide-phosphate guanylyltransferase
MLSLVIGGARSGKSRFAQSLGAEARHPVFLATARAEDDEMKARIARHRDARPAHWTTVEAPLEIARAVEAQAGQCDFLLLDCLTLWLANFLAERADCPAEAMEAAALGEIARLAEAAGACHVVLVSNEVGCGVVPEYPLGRLFRDLQGWVNQEAARRADWVYHMVAGIATAIKKGDKQ